MRQPVGVLALGLGAMMLGLVGGIFLVVVMVRRALGA